MPMTHLYTEEIAQADLINVVGDELIVLKISSRNVTVRRRGRNIRLKECC